GERPAALARERLGKVEDLSQNAPRLLEVDAGARHRTQSQAGRAGDPRQGVCAWLPGTALVGVDHRPRHARTPSKLGLAEVRVRSHLVHEQRAGAIAVHAEMLADTRTLPTP